MFALRHIIPFVDHFHRNAAKGTYTLKKKNV